MADAVVIKIDGDATQFNAAMAGVQNTAQSSMGSLSGSVLKGIASWNLLNKAINMTKSLLTGVMSAGESFESAMSSVEAISGATGDELTKLEDAAKNAGATTVFSATEAAEALKYMALAGWDADQSVEGLNGVLDLAAASGMELQTASDFVTDYISAFGLAASDSQMVSDLMVYANNNANTSAQQLGEAYGNCATNLAAAGQTIQSTTALLMGMADVGEKGSSAGTSLSAIVAQLTQKMQNGVVTINGVNVAVADETGEWRDLVDIMYDINAATAGLSSTARSEALGSVFNRNSLTAMNTIFAEGVDKIKAYENELNTVDGAAKESSETMQDNIQGAQKALESVKEAMFITAYDDVKGVYGEALSLGKDIFSAINEAGKTGGIDAMISELINQISAAAPSVIGKVGSLLTNVFKSLKSKMPSLMKGFVSTLPQMISSSSEFLSSIAELAASAAESLVTELIGSIETLIPSLVDGIENLTRNILTALGNSIYNVENSILKKLGFEGMSDKVKSPDEIIQEWAAENQDYDKLIDLGSVTPTIELKTIQL